MAGSSPAMTTFSSNEFARRANHPKVCKAPLAKIFWFTEIANQSISTASRSTQRGVSRTSRTSGRDAVDAAVRETGDLAADGQVVWSWHLDAGVKLAVGPAGDGGKRARSPGRARRKRVPWKGTVL